MQTDSSFYKKVVAYGAVVCVITILLVFALHAYPVTGGDSILYIPAAINIKLGNGFVNQLSPAFLSGDPTGTGRFLSLPPLWPIALSWLMPKGTPEAAHQAIFLLNAATILLASFIYAKILIPNWQKTSWYKIAVYVASIGSLASITIFYPGRPETLTRLLTIISLLGLLMPYKKWLWILLGITLGLNIANSPGPAILFGPLIGIFFAFHYPAKRALWMTLLTYLTSLVIAVGVIQVFSYGIGPVFYGLYRHFFVVQSGNLGDHFQEVKITLVPILNKQFIMGLLTILTTSGSAAFAGSVFSLSFAYAISLYRRWKNTIAARAPLYAFSAIAAGALFLFLFLRPVAYYVLALVPLSIIIVGYYASNVTRSRILKAASLIILLLSSIVFVHRLILFPVFLSKGVSLTEAREKFRELSFRPDERIGVDGTIWPVSENYNQIYMWGDEEDVKYPTTTIIMREGLNGWTELPEEWSYCRKTKDFSTHKKPVLFGITLTNAIPGYAFNVYDCSAGKEKAAP